MTVARSQRVEPGAEDAAGSNGRPGDPAASAAADPAVPGRAEAGATAAPWAGPALQRAAFAVGRRLRSRGLAVSNAWQRSLQLRVATTTLVLTGTVVLVIGIFIVDQVAGGVLHAKRAAAVSQANIGLATARAVLRNKSVSSPSGSCRRP